MFVAHYSRISGRSTVCTDLPRRPLAGAHYASAPAAGGRTIVGCPGFDVDRFGARSYEPDSDRPVQGDGDDGRRNATGLAKRFIAPCKSTAITVLPRACWNTHATMIAAAGRRENSAQLGEPSSGVRRSRTMGDATPPTRPRAAGWRGPLTTAPTAGEAHTRATPPPRQPLRERHDDEEDGDCHDPIVEGHRANVDPARAQHHAEPRDQAPASAGPTHTTAYQRQPTRTRVRRLASSRSWLRRQRCQQRAPWR